MRAMIKSNPTSGYSILLIPENDLEKGLLDNDFHMITRADVVKATLHSGGQPMGAYTTGEVHIRLVGEHYERPEDRHVVKFARESER